MIRKILTTYVARLDEYLARSHRQPEGVAEVGLIGSAGEQCPNKLVVSLVNLEREASGVCIYSVMYCRGTPEILNTVNHIQNRIRLFNRSQDRIRIKAHIPDISTYKVIMASCIRSIYGTGSIKAYRFMMGDTVSKFTNGCQFSVNI